MARPCCMWQGLPVGNFNTQSLDEIWQGKPMQTLREQFRRGERPQGCTNCWRAEAAGYTSKRQNDNNRFKHHQENVTLDAPVYLDLKLGSLCNIKCRICSTQYSQKWRDDETKLFGSPRYDTVLGWLDESSPFWQDLEQIAPTIEFIDFTGGEPFLVKGHWLLLERLVELGVSNQISIHYNTNGTILPEQRDLWQHFRYVEIAYSFDGVGPRFEYQRHPARWSTCEQNFRTVLEEGVARVSLCYTVNMFSVMYMQEFDEWAPTPVYWNILYGPEHYSIRECMPESAKQLIADTIPDDGVRDYMLSGASDPRWLEEFRTLTLELDQIRGENFKSVFPELAQKLNI